MAVPVSRLNTKDGVVLHLRGGNDGPPVYPPCRDGPPASYAYLRSTGSTNAPRFLDLYYIPPKVGEAVNLAPVFYATPAPGDEFEVIVAANRSGVAARDRAYRALPYPYDRLEVALSVDGVATQYFSFWTRRTIPNDVLYRGWPEADDHGGCTVAFRRFRMDRTVGVAGDAAAVAADARPDLGCLSLTWRPCRRKGVISSPQAWRGPAAAPTLPEREAVKNRSLATGVGASVKVQRANNFSVDRGRPLPSEEVTIYYRERRVLVARKVLLETGEVAPAYREAVAAGSGGGGGTASGSAAEPSGVPVEGSPAGSSGTGKGKGPRLGGGGSSAFVVKPEGGSGGAAARAACPSTLTPVKAEASGADGGTAASAGGSGGGSRKRKAEVEIIVLD